MNGRRHDGGVTLGPGERFAPFTLPTLRAGQTNGYRPGRVTVFSFCALWCITWEEQARRIGRVASALAGLPIDYRTISVDGRWAERYRPAVGEAGDVLLDVGGAVSSNLGVRAVPYTFIVDAQGIIRFAHQGIVRAEDLIAVLRSLATGRPATPTDAAIYLTFDDFPTIRDSQPTLPSDDELLLDILRARRVPATFFCIAEHLTTDSGRIVARRALREGHALQIHSWSHDRSDPQLPRCVRALAALAPDLPPPTLYRPPGRSDLLTLDGRTRQPIHPVVNPYDFARPGIAELSRRILQSTRPGSVIQLHAGVSETRDALPQLIDGLQRQNLTFALLR